MKRCAHTSMALSAVVFALVVPASRQEAAATDAATMVGTGTISPGLPPTGCSFQSVTFSGTVVDGGLYSGIHNVAFDGASTICESVAAGQGSASLSGDVSGQLSYSRTFSHLSMTGVVTMNDTLGVFTGQCQWTPTAANPATSYQMTCAWVLDRDPAVVRAAVESMVVEHQEGTWVAASRTVDTMSLTLATDVAVDLSRRAPTDAHDLTSTCTYHVHRPTGIVSVVGKTKAGRHPRATATRVRCRIETFSGLVVFDQARAAGDDTVVLDGSFATVATKYRVCTHGEGWWGDDDHHVALGLLCR